MCGFELVWDMSTRVIDLLSSVSLQTSGLKSLKFFYGESVGSGKDKSVISILLWFIRRWMGRYLREHTRWTREYFSCLDGLAIDEGLCLPV